MKIIIIIQARMSSTRLPGKVLLPLGDDSVLGHVVRRSLRVTRVHHVIVATTIKRVDDPIAAFCAFRGYLFARGDEQDVLGRYYQVATQYEADVIVRITSDCPLIDPEVIDEMISRYVNDSSLEYYTNTLDRTYPRGLDVEIVSYQALKAAYENAVLSFDREHVTPYIRFSSSQFTIGSHRAIFDASKYRWTLDTVEDYQLFTELSHLLEISEAKTETILNVFHNNPHLYFINYHVEQKSDQRPYNDLVTG